MRITFLLPRYPWGASGGYSVVYTYAGLLAQRGHHVRVVHPRRLPPGGWPAPVGMTGTLRRAAGRLRDRIARPSIRWAAPDSRIEMLYVPHLGGRFIPDGDALIATWWSTAEAALALPQSKGRAYHLIQGYESWHGSEDRVVAVWRAPLHKIIIARWLVQRALELGVPPDSITHIPNAISGDLFRVLRPIVGRPRRVAALYSALPLKGAATALEILHRARSRVPDLRAVLFGVERGPRLPSWIEYVRNADAQRLAVDVYNRSSVYLCASTSEGWHLPPAEAMACGCAVVSSDIGGVHDYARDGETALLYPAGDAAAGAERLIELLLDDTLRTELAMRGRDRIAEFSWTRSADALEALLASGTAPERLGGTLARESARGAE